MDLNTWIKKRLAGENVPLGIPTDRQNLKGLILEDAIAYHIAWRDRWTQALRERRGDEFDVSQVADDSLCKVGQWLYGPGKDLAAFPEYEVFREQHAQFHKCAGRIVDMHKKGRFAESLVAIRKELMPISEKVGLALGGLLEATYRP